MSVTRFNPHPTIRPNPYMSGLTGGRSTARDTWQCSDKGEMLSLPPRIRLTLAFGDVLRNSWLHHDILKPNSRRWGNGLQVGLANCSRPFGIDQQTIPLEVMNT